MSAYEQPTAAPVPVGSHLDRLEPVESHTREGSSSEDSTSRTIAGG